MNNSNYSFPSSIFAVARATAHVSLRLIAILVFSACLLLSLPTVTLFGQTSGSLDATHLGDSGLLIVGYDPDAGGESALEELRVQGYEVQAHWPRLRLVSLRVAEIGAADQASALRRAADRVQTLSGITHVSGDVTLRAAVQAARPPAQAGAPAAHVASLPDDPLIDQQWAITQMAALAGWQISRGAPSVTIALIDSGFDITHEDLAATSLWENAVEVAGEAGIDDDNNGFVDDLNGWDWIDGDGVTNDPYGHGSHTGGIIAATSDNGLGIAGFAGDVRILPLRILDAYGGGQLSDLIAALDYALSQNVDVVNLSLTLNSDQPALAQAVDVLTDAGILLVAAAGNNNGPVVWPAAYPGTLAVAATTPDDARATFSNSGPAIDLAAPGQAILSTYSEGSYASLDGTSMAVPHVAALAGLLAALRPDLAGPDLARLMQSTAVDVNAATLPGHDPEIGAGRIDFGAALYAASQAFQLEQDAAEGAVAPVFPGTATRRDWFLSVTGPTGDVLPVTGAHGNFRVYAATEPTQSLAGGPLQSDAAGRVSVAFVAPGVPGEYLLEMTMGAFALQQPLLVSTPLVEVRLMPQSHTVQAASGPQPIGLEVRAAQGRPLDMPLQVELVTNLGYFGEERTQGIEILLESGVGEVLFRPGDVAGLARLTASIGELTGTAEIEILPGGAESVQLPSLPKQVTVMDEPVVVTLEIRVVDRFDNPVADGTEVELAASAGNLILLDRTTEQGTLMASLMVSAGDVSPVQLRAAVPDSPARAEADLTLQSYHQWLPIITQSTP